MSDAEKSRASIESKFVMSRWIFAREKLDRGTAPYQDFALLIFLRNALVHFKATDAVALPSTPEKVHEKLFNKFKDKNILATDGHPYFPWTFFIQTKATAGWACKTASAMIVDFLNKMPQSTAEQASFKFIVDMLTWSFVADKPEGRVETWPLVGQDPE